MLSREYGNTVGRHTRGSQAVTTSAERPHESEVKMSHFLRRTAIVGSVSAAFIVVAGAPGLAASPNGGCGNAFTWATIEEIRELRPAMPPGVAESVDLNGNGALCYQELIIPNYPSPNYGHLNLVDDRGPERP